MICSGLRDFTTCSPLTSTPSIWCGEESLFPDLFLHAANEMGHAPKNCLAIEDGIAGVQAGCAAGMRVLGFTGGSHCDPEHRDRLKAAGADLVFSDVGELPPLIEASPAIRDRLRRNP